MIVRDRPSAFQLFFIMRGSIVPRIKWQVLCTVGVAVLVTMAHGTLFNQKVTLTPIPFSLIGLALATIVFVIFAKLLALILPMGPLERLLV